MLGLVTTAWSSQQSRQYLVTMSRLTSAAFGLWHRQNFAWKTGLSVRSSTTIYKRKYSAADTSLLIFHGSPVIRARVLYGLCPYASDNQHLSTWIPFSMGITLKQTCWRDLDKCVTFFVHICIYDVGDVQCPIYVIFWVQKINIENNDQLWRNKCVCFLFCVLLCTWSTLRGLLGDDPAKYFQSPKNNLSLGFHNYSCRKHARKVKASLVRPYRLHSYIMDDFALCNRWSAAQCIKTKLHDSAIHACAYG